MNQSKVLLTAAWVAPIDAPVIRDGGVLIQGDRIAGVGQAKSLRANHPDAILHEYGDAVILPGLVNAHTHLELSECVCGESTASFTDWIASIPGRIGPGRDFAAAALAGAAQSLRFGVTTVGDISQQCQITRPALRDGPLRVVSYGEVLGIGGTRFKVDDLLARAVDRSCESEYLRVALSPHATYSLDWKNYVRVAQAAGGMPVASHVAELSYEREFLQHRRGPLREFLEQMGIWRDDIESFDGGPIELARAAGLLDSPSLLAHVNYCCDDELAELRGSQASVVYCPRTHQYFGHPPHRWREMLDAGVNVALGTDSCASSPNLNLVDDLRLVREIAPEIEVEKLWEMVTLRGARAVCAEKNVGSLSIGKFADLVVFPIRSEEPLVEILESDVQPTAVWIGGELRVIPPA